MLLFNSRAKIAIYRHKSHGVHDGGIPARGLGPSKDRHASSRIWFDCGSSGMAKSSNVVGCVVSFGLLLLLWRLWLAAVCLLLPSRFDLQIMTLHSNLRLCPDFCCSSQIWQRPTCNETWFDLHIVNLLANLGASRATKPDLILVSSIH